MRWLQEGAVVGVTPSLYTFYIACGLAQLEAFLAEEGER